MRIYNGLEYNENFTICYGPKDVNISKVIFHPDTIQINKSAFENCKNFSELHFPDKLETIGYGAFQHCNVEKVSFPDSLKLISHFAFLYTPLKEADLSNTNVDIEPYAFDKKLETFIHPQTDLQYLSLPENITFLDLSKAKINILNKKLDTLFKLEHIILPDTLECISRFVFYGTSLLDINLPQNLKILEEGCFNNTFVNKITLPNSLMHVEDFLFGSNIETIYYDSSKINKNVLLDIKELIGKYNINLEDISFDSLITKNTFKKVNTFLKCTDTKDK